MRAAAFFLTLLLCAASAEAGFRTPIPVDADAHVKISVDCSLFALPLTGYAPIDVEINNFSGQTRQWTFEFSSPGYAPGSANTMQSTFTVTVENNGTRTTPLMVPMSSNENGMGQMPLSVRVTGYGTEAALEQPVGGRPWSGKPLTPFVLISDSQGTAIWGNLSKQLEGEGRDLMGSTINPDDLPEDWRGLSGVAAIWLSGDDLNRLSAAQRDAMQTWVHAGGLLMLCGANTLPEDLRFAGFGSVSTSPAPMDINATADLIRGLPPKDGSFDATATPQYADLAEVRPNVLLLSGLMALFAIVVGPVNIFAFAKKRRERLFWTTPLISLCASGLLMSMIVAKDGAGGHGFRTAVVCLFPQSHNAVVMQEQISRTGLLLGSTFQTRDPVCMRQLDIQARDVPSYGVIPKGRELRNEGTAYGGEWFASRSAQAQRVVCVTPTRAEITLLNAADVRDKEAAPVIVSSFESTLDTLTYNGEDHRKWRGRDVRTGEKQTLQLLTDASPMISEPFIPMGMISSGALLRFLQGPGSFVATSSHASDYIQTLDSIHWTDQPITYVGPVTNAP